MYGDTLQTMRTAKGMPRKEFAYEIGVSYEVLKNWEKNITSIPIEFIVPICNLLGCSTDKFLNIHNKDFEWYLKSHDDAIKLINFVRRSPSNKRMALYIFNEFEGDPTGILMLSNYFALLPPIKRYRIALDVFDSFEHEYMKNAYTQGNYAHKLYEMKQTYFNLCKNLKERIENE